MFTSDLYAALKADIAANTATVTYQGNQVAIKDLPNTGDANNEIANWYNQAVSPAYWGWRSDLSKEELTQESGVDSDGTTVTAFVWGGATGGFINRSQAERDAFNTIFGADHNVNPTLANVRTAFADIFSGAGAGAVANRAHCFAKGRRSVTRVEKLYVSATVGGPQQTGNRGAATNPDTLGFEGSLSNTDVSNARDS